MAKAVKRNILLNPGPATTTESVKYAQVVPDICPREKEFNTLMDDIRTKLVRVVHGGDRYTAIPFASSGTGAVEACISSILSNDKKILIIDNGAYGKRMIEIAQRFYKPDQIIAYQIPWGDYPDVNAIKGMVRNDGDVGVVAVVHHETTTGMLNPIEEINKIAHHYGADVVVDTISSYAGVPIDLREDDYDYITSSANKCIQGMAGISFVICKRENLLKTKNIKPRNYYFNLWQQFRFFEENKQMQFTPPVQTAYALNRALDEFFEETGERRFKRYRDSWKTLIRGLEDLNFKFLVPQKYQSGLLTAVIDPEDTRYDFDEMHDYLLERGFTIYPGKGAKKDTFRIANIGAINQEDISRFLKILKEYLTSRNIRIV
jgi:2-aminoethylphosphonate-pyruvate transaminase